MDGGWDEGGIMGLPVVTATFGFGNFTTLNC